MITFYVKELMLSRGYKYPNNTLRKLGFHYNLARQILSGQARSLNLNQLESLCIFLNCTPNDLLNFAPHQKNYIQSAHPLNEISKETDAMGPIDYLRNLSPANLRKAGDMLKQLHEQI